MSIQTHPANPMPRDLTNRELAWWLDQLLRSVDNRRAILKRERKRLAEEVTLLAMTRREIARRNRT